MQMKEPCFVYYGTSPGPFQTVKSDVLYPGQLVKMADGTRRKLRVDPDGPDYVVYHGERVSVQV